MDKPYEAFSHGLVISKLWLCEELEQILGELDISAPEVHILGGWHNILAFMMLIRKPTYYSSIDSYDLSKSSTEVANKICDTWKHEYPRVTNHNIDANDLVFKKDSKNLIFINCSIDQFIGTYWYDVIPYGNIVVLQTTDLEIGSVPWEITQHTKNVEILSQKYPLQKILFTGVKKIDYGDLRYNRLMVIGIK